MALDPASGASVTAVSDRDAGPSSDSRHACEVDLLPGRVVDQEPVTHR